MTKAEAIVILQESMRQNKVIQESPNTFFRSADITTGVKNAEKRIEALNMAIAALYIYAQQDAPPNDPLTLEELREMDGEPVYLPSAKSWALVTCDIFEAFLTFPDGVKCSACSFYSRRGPAYSRRPEEGTIWQ